MVMPGSAVSRWPGSLFEDPGEMVEWPSAALYTAEGEKVSINSRRWHGCPSQGEQDLLDRSIDPVLDIGCGPGRHVVALVRAGRIALGIDSSIAAVAAAQRRGAPALRVSVFGSVPGCGSWGTALLLDGNIGIGGNPRMLLARVAELLGPDGHALVEVESSEVRTERLRVRVEHAGRRGHWFPWARVGIADLGEICEAAGFSVTDLWQSDHRWFADLARE